MIINEGTESMNLRMQESDLDCLIQFYLHLWSSLKTMKRSDDLEILEKLLLKIQLNFFSIAVLLKGTKYKNLENVFDIPSIYTLSRTLIENYLTIEYLFVISDDLLNKTTRADRIRNYKLTGYKNLKKIEKIHHNIQRVKEIDKIIERLRKEFENSKTGLESYNPDIFEQTRMGYSWGSLVAKSKLHTDFFNSKWKLFSNFAHSEFIYNEGINNFINQPYAFIERRMCYRISLIIISQLITVITEIFPESLRNVFDKSKVEMRNLVYYYIDINRF